MAESAQQAPGGGGKKPRNAVSLSENFKLPKTTTHFPDGFLAELPKIDLHVHLDGSIRWVVLKFKQLLLDLKIKTVQWDHQLVLNFQQWV